MCWRVAKGGGTLALLLVVGVFAWAQSTADDPAASPAASAVAPSTAVAPANASSSGSSTSQEAPEKEPEVLWPMIVLLVGIVVVLALIIGLKVNAFLALITAAIVVSLMAEGPLADKMARVAMAFGEAAGKIGIVIALAAVIGKCMLDSGAADRIVRAFLRLFGEPLAPFALLGSGFVLAVPVFFDTVFYLLVPLARSLYRKTRVHFLLYVLAIGAGGAITHTLVPPTPGPLVMASQLDFDVGVMIIVGLLVAVPAALAGLAFSVVADRLMPIPMRPIGNEPEPKPLDDSELAAAAGLPRTGGAAGRADFQQYGVETIGGQCCCWIVARDFVQGQRDTGQRQFRLAHLRRDCHPDAG